ncbi:MAG TPA: MarR family transcriptional regulator [Euzebyales bacterium]
MTTSEALRGEIRSSVVRFIADAVLFNHAVAQREGLGPSDAQFLTLLRAHGPMTAGELSARTGLTSGSTTGVLDRLEHAGLAVRRRDPEDRRRVIVSADEAGLAARLGPHYAEQAERLDQVLARRSHDDLRVVAAFLADVLADRPEASPAPTRPDDEGDTSIGNST